MTKLLTEKQLQAVKAFRITLLATAVKIHKADISKGENRRVLVSTYGTYLTGLALGLDVSNQELENELDGLWLGSHDLNRLIQYHDIDSLKFYIKGELKK